MALTEPGGHVLQMLDLYSPNISTLISASVDLVDKAHCWREALASIGGEQNEAEDDIATAELPTHALRA